MKIRGFNKVVCTVKSQSCKLQMHTHTEKLLEGNALKWWGLWNLSDLTFLVCAFQYFPTFFNKDILFCNQEIVSFIFK